RLELHQRVPKPHPGRVLPPNRHHGRPSALSISRHRENRSLAKGFEGPGTHTISGHKGGAKPRIAVLRQLNGNPRVGVDFNGHLPGGQPGILVQPTEAPKRSNPPLLFPPSRNREVGQLKRLHLVQPGNGGARLDRPLKPRHQPTAPSICSSISRFSSSAYSIGSSRAIGSTNPRTIVAMASSSVMPRLIR